MVCAISFKVGRPSGTRSSARVSTFAMSVDHSSLSNYAEIGTKSAHYGMRVSCGYFYAPEFTYCE